MAFSEDCSEGRVNSLLNMIALLKTWPCILWGFAQQASIIEFLILQQAITHSLRSAFATFQLWSLLPSEEVKIHGLLTVWNDSYITEWKLGFEIRFIQYYTLSEGIHFKVKLFKTSPPLPHFSLMVACLIPQQWEVIKIQKHRSFSPSIIFCPWKWPPCLCGKDIKVSLI